jgi:chromosome segregation ATPase
VTDDLTGLPGRVHAELTRLRAERQVYAAEQDRLKARLAETEQELQGLMANIEALAEKDKHIAELSARCELLQRQYREMDARAQALASDVAVARQGRDSLRAELVSARAERDRLRMRLLDAEVALASKQGDAPTGELSVYAQRALQAERLVGQIAQELTATRQTVSWRVTKPLRAVRRKINK